MYESGSYFAIISYIWFHERNTKEIQSNNQEQSYISLNLFDFKDPRAARWANVPDQCMNR